MEELLSATEALPVKEWPEGPFLALTAFGYRLAGLDWFDEQAEDADLMRRRGLRPGEPLPRSMGLFDSDGRPQSVQKRASWLLLREWLANDQEILAFVFPEGLAADERDLLLDDLAQLRSQPWSPQSALDAMLEDWPEDEPEREITLERADKAVVVACEGALTELAKKESSDQ
jgi:hypothetical protein